MYGSLFRAQGAGLRVQDSFTVHGSGFRVQGSGLRVQGLGVWGFGGHGCRIQN